MSGESVTSEKTVTRCGLVALVGKPNAGKSTLLNHLVGETLSAVTPLAQTTRQRITGIRTEGGSQMVFLDTPGLISPRNLLQASMVTAARAAVSEADVWVALVDATRSGSRQGRAEIEALVEERPDVPPMIAVNKRDLAGAEAMERTMAWARTLGHPVPISATTGAGVPDLLTEIEQRLPKGPFLYPAEDLAAESVRFFVRERIRETLFEQFRQEVPYSTVVQIEDFRENQQPIYIQATLYVERDSQKRILIGSRGSAIRELGRASRAKVEELVGRPVYLELWVKVLAGWRKKKSHLTRFGYRVPDDVHSPT